MNTPALDLRLAHELELAEAQAAVACAQMMNMVQPRASSAFEPIAGGYAVYSGANNPVTQAVALGLDGPVTAADTCTRGNLSAGPFDAARALQGTQLPRQ